jgi:hypothetical protein
MCEWALGDTVALTPWPYKALIVHMPSITLSDKSKRREKKPGNNRMFVYFFGSSMVSSAIWKNAPVIFFKDDQN